MRAAKRTTAVEPRLLPAEAAAAAGVPPTDAARAAIVKTFSC